MENKQMSEYLICKMATKIGSTLALENQSSIQIKGFFDLTFRLTIEHFKALTSKLRMIGMFLRVARRPILLPSLELPQKFGNPSIWGFALFLGKSLLLGFHDLSDRCRDVLGRQSGGGGVATQKNRT